MSITPSPIPSSSEGRPVVVAGPPPDPPSRLPLILLACVTVIGLGGLFYYIQQLDNRVTALQTTVDSNMKSQGETLQDLSARLQKLDSRRENLEGELTAAQKRLGTTQSALQQTQQTAAQLAEEQKRASEQFNSQLGQLQQQNATTSGQLGNLSTDVNGVKTDVKSTKDQLDATRAQLQRVVGDLGVTSDRVAHNQTELDALKRLGERDYVEFDLKKTKQPQRFGTVQLQLKNTDAKRQKYTLTLIADDKTIEKKDKTVFEPVQFYQEGLHQPTEIVVNKVEKDHIVGYVSSPKKPDTRAPMKNS